MNEKRAIANVNITNRSLTDQIIVRFIFDIIDQTLHGGRNDHSNTITVVHIVADHTNVFSSFYMIAFIRCIWTV